MKSEKINYVLAHKRAVVANGIALATAINQLAEFTKINPQLLIKRITQAAAAESESLSQADVEELIEESINASCHVKTFYFKPPEESV